MKVLHVGEYVQGGVATYIRTLLDHPDYPEIEDYLVCSDYNSDHSWKLPEDRIYYYSYKRTLGNIPNAIKAIYRVVKHVKPDVIYCHSTWAGLFVRLPLFFLPKHCRIITMLMDGLFEGHDKFEKGIIRLNREGIVYSHRCHC